jgi:methyl-accepting chemotaxis protein
MTTRSSSNSPACSGPLWIAEHVALLAAAVCLVWWVWRYLTKRFLTQLFLTMTSFTVTIVLVATVSITTLLLSSLQKDALASLETAAKVLNYAINAKTSETRANATVLSQTPAAITAATTGNHATAAKLTTDLLVKQHLSDVIITSDTGQVLARASDPDRYGDSLSDDTLVKRALVGATVTTTASRSGVLAPELLITTASPIRDAGDHIVGVALASLSLDNTFVDGIKHTTGLDSAVYAGGTRTATTLVGPDGTSRSIGVKETSAGVKDSTLTHGKIWRGSLNISNVPYLAIYLPLKDVDNTVVGMLFVGQVQDTVLQSASQAVRLTFGLAVLWLLIIMAPIYLISRFIARQLH